MNNIKKNTIRSADKELAQHCRDPIQYDDCGGEYDAVAIEFGGEDAVVEAQDGEFGECDGCGVDQLEGDEDFLPEEEFGEWLFVDGFV